MYSLKDCHELVQDHLERIGLPEKPPNLYDPIRYVLGSGGKRIRPALVLMGCNLFSDDVAPALQAALAVEVFHNFTLMHDDIMDRAVMRRNRPAVHVQWNQNVAILSGDAMLIKAYELLSASPVACLPEVLRTFNKTALKVCEGQQYDMDFEEGTGITLQEYLDMVELKTAALLAASLKIGAVIGGAGETEVDLIYEFGRSIGIAFQLQDDLLDVNADPGEFGKLTGNDIVTNKKTVLLVLALQEADAGQKKVLLKWLGARKFDREEKVRRISGIYDRLGLKKITLSMVTKYHEQALDMLKRISCPAGRKEELIRFSRTLINRRK